MCELGVREKCGQRVTDMFKESV